VDLPDAIELVLGCCKGLRLPEPTRLAHHAAERATVDAATASAATAAEGS